MSDEKTTAPQPPQLPIMALLSVDAYGAAPDGARSQMKVTTATQEIIIAMEFETMVNLAVTLKAAIHQCRQNNVASGAPGMAQAAQIAKFATGRSEDVKGVLMVLDEGMPSETMYIIPDFFAIDMGKKLMAEGQRQRNVEQAVTKGVQAVKQKIIMPRDVH